MTRDRFPLVPAVDDRQCATTLIGHVREDGGGSLNLYAATGQVGGVFSAELVAGALNNENGVSGTNTADFSDTVQLQSVDVIDANGNVVQGTFSDGDQLLFLANTPLITTPEPETITMLIPGLILLTVAGLRFRRTVSAAPSY